MKQEGTQDWVHLFRWAVLSMNSQHSSPPGYTPRELFHGGPPAWFSKTSFLEDCKSRVGDCLEHKQDLALFLRANLKHVCERELTRRNRTRQPTDFKVDNLVLVQNSRLPSWLCNWLQDPFFRADHMKGIDGSRIHVRCSPRLDGELLCAPKQLNHYGSPDYLA